MKRIKTQWDVRTYDVWGNAAEGYEVNNVFQGGTVTLWLRPVTYGDGRPYQITAAFPTDRQLQRVLGVRCAITTSGDDLSIYVDRASDGFPLGELFCTSHTTLSIAGDQL